MPEFALLFFLAGFFFQIQSVSAQELPAQLPADAGSAVNIEESAALNQSNAAPLRAAEEALPLSDNTSPILTGTGGMSAWAVIRMILVLALAAAAVYGIVFLFKRASKPAQEIDPFLKILANAHLGSNRYVHVVSLGNKTWLLGASDGGVNIIDEITDPDVINAMLLEDSKKAAQTPGRLSSFIFMLRRLGTQAKSNAPGADDIRKRRERLKRL